MPLADRHGRRQTLEVKLIRWGLISTEDIVPRLPEAIARGGEPEVADALDQESDWSDESDRVSITGFIWLEDIVEKLWRKHQVDEYEVEEVFGNRPYFRFVEKGYRLGEDVYAALGQTDGGRYLAVFFVHKVDGRALIVSARDMKQAERRHYEKR